jgi:hypothetical protein
MIWVTDAPGRRVEGKVQTDKEETVWRFTPAQPWAKGPHHLVANTALEDLGGNSIAQPFEVDVLRPIQRNIKEETTRLPFEVK